MKKAYSFITVFLFVLTIYLSFNFGAFASNNIEIESTNPRKTIWTIGDSITAGYLRYEPRDPASLSNRVNNSYQYWLDQYLNSNASSINSGSISIYNKG